MIGLLEVSKIAVNNEYVNFKDYREQTEGRKALRNKARVQAMGEVFFPPMILNNVIIYLFREIRENVWNICCKKKKKDFKMVLAIPFANTYMHQFRSWVRELLC